MFVMVVFVQHRSVRITVSVLNLVQILKVGYFCFQAEDGIRVRLVTGVQTCALPI